MADCQCMKRGHFCDKYCQCPLDCPNRFKGCRCKAGRCRTKACPCFGLARECDPDLCTMCHFSCRRHKRLLIAPSDIAGAGWGAFAHSEIRKGEFVCEYLGERISQHEADRRGPMYDVRNRSYLFNLNSEAVIDQHRKGNKSKFANHSELNPNCGSRIIMVRGDHRIGIFALRDIAAQEELLFNYRYREGEVVWTKEEHESMKAKAHGHKRRAKNAAGAAAGKPMGHMASTAAAAAKRHKR
ncbi:enhancer of zeste 2 [Tribonema minus]|uniref:Enhancer of zeste 2 n=1 Tax=Tribonema minus TaxID=303371 RepID=A0A835YXW2_9STRA|nr:enhancer of zeste 2 [Tribonema minus]